MFSALQLSRETVEQIIDESDIAERKSFDEPAGLKNIGNTCWFNSIVQALYTLPYFRQLLLNFRYVSNNRALTDSVCYNLFYLILLLFFFEINLGTTSNWNYRRITKFIYFNVKITTSFDKS